MSQGFAFDFTRLWDRVKDELRENGIDFDLEVPGFSFKGGAEGRPRVKVVCVDPDLSSSVEEMEQTQRDQVVMVRVDGETLEDLDAWVATGAVKSRSEAAALFIREGLKVREGELAQLREALREVQAAQERLQTKAQEVFGKAQAPPPEPPVDPGSSEGADSDPPDGS